MDWDCWLLVVGCWLSVVVQENFDDKQVFTARMPCINWSPRSHGITFAILG
jgi:hypothetical protein